ncbi:hypothetical protein BIW11_07521 [Tropilaelaps mercedesae]|uniref:Uncharacterized protein n=1 Tax=Tropilaelaps mercedesae TaxID=418985 RepID=A0A1V9XTU0_9ACAR|nr:hypothetical protein BIW11_07521 [Tropilaelaps mercedesae]
MSQKDRQSRNMPMSKYFGEAGKKPVDFSDSSGSMNTPGSSVRRSLKYPDERPNLFTGEGVRRKETKVIEGLKREQLPEDLSDMFCNLVLTPEEINPIEEEKVAASSYNQCDRQFKHADGPSQKGNPNSSNNKEEDNDDPRLAHAEYVSDLSMLSSGAPPPLKMLLDEPLTPNKMQTQRQVTDGLNSIGQQVMKLYEEMDNFREIDQFFRQICGPEDQTENLPPGDPDNNA